MVQLPSTTCLFGSGTSIQMMQTDICSEVENRPHGHLFQWEWHFLTRLPVVPIKGICRFGGKDTYIPGIGKIPSDMPDDGESDAPRDDKQDRVPPPYTPWWPVKVPSDMPDEPKKKPIETPEIRV